MRRSTLGTFIFFMLLSSHLYGQSFPYHYFRHVNPMSSNPSLAAIDDKTNITVANYNLWAGGFKPVKDYMLSFSTPIDFKKSKRASYYQNRVGIGAVLIHEQIGPFSQNLLHLIYSYHIPMTNTAELSLGIVGIVENINVDINSMSPLQPNDPRLLTGNNNAFLFDGGFGASISGENYLVSVSALNLAPGIFKFKSSEAEEINEYCKFFLSASYSFELSEKILLQPSTTLRNTYQNKVAYDASLGCNMFFLSFGAGYRSENTLFVFTKVAFQDFVFSYTSENPLSSNHMIGNGHTFSLGWSFSK